MLRRQFLSWLGLGIPATAAPSLEPIAQSNQQLLAGVTPLKAIRPLAIRLWKLGSLEYRHYPSEMDVQNLTDTLSKWDGKSDLDIIWGPELNLEVNQFYGGLDLVAGPGIRLERIDEKTLRVVIDRAEE